VSGALSLKIIKIPELQLLLPGPFTRQQAEAITSRYQNIAIDDDQSRVATSA